jgi:argininosuccinate lyase
MAATEIADYLARQDIPFREAHGVVKQIVEYCIKNSKDLNSLSLQEYNKFYPKKYPTFKSDIFKFISLENIIEKKNSEGGTSKKSVEKQTALLKNRLKRK